MADLVGVLLPYKGWYELSLFITVFLWHQTLFCLKKETHCLQDEKVLNRDDIINANIHYRMFKL